MSSQREPPCRYQFVLQWLEDHAKYFGHPASKPELPPLVIANRSFPSQAYASQSYASQAYASQAYASQAYASQAYASQAYASQAYASQAYASQAYANQAYASQAYTCQCNEAVQNRSNVVNQLYIQPPYKVSPMKPPPPYTDPNNFAFFC